MLKNKNKSVKIKICTEIIILKLYNLQHITDLIRRKKQNTQEQNTTICNEGDKHLLRFKDPSFSD